MLRSWLSHWTIPLRGNHQNLTQFLTSYFHHPTAFSFRHFGTELQTARLRRPAANRFHQHTVVAYLEPFGEIRQKYIYIYIKLYIYTLCGGLTSPVFDVFLLSSPTLRAHRCRALSPHRRPRSTKKSFHPSGFHRHRRSSDKSSWPRSWELGAGGWEELAYWWWEF
jgi:hypothetical protein